MHPSSLPFKIKICGVTQVDDALAVRESGADAIGLNFYPKSKRFVDPYQARAISDALDQAELSEQKQIQRVGVFVNAPIDSVLQCLQSLRLDGVQLHGDETIEYFRDLKAQFEKFTLPPKSERPYTIRAIRTQPVSSTGQQQPTEFERVSRELNRWSEAGVDLILLDAAQPGEYGGTGKVVDWNSTRKLQNHTDRPIVLAGGLGHKNVAEAIETSGVEAVDVASGVETAPGKKCPDLMRQFVQQALVGLAKR